MPTVVLGESSVRVTATSQFKPAYRGTVFLEHANSAP